MSTVNTLNTAAVAAQAAQEHATAKAASGLDAVTNLFKEAHPFARKSAILRPHTVPWEVYARKVGRAAFFYFPGMMLVLGWPLAAKALINYTNGVYDKPSKQSRR